jgi:hypothetical protein
MMYFGGLTAEEAAQVLGISLRTAKRDWQAARAWLSAELARSPHESPAVARRLRLFHAALDLPASRIDEFLRAECGSDTELYAKLCEMVREHMRSGRLDRPVVDLFDGKQLVFHEGQLVAGRYGIVRFIGRGGMGEVYEAENHDLNERIALEILLPAIAGDTRMVSRFKQEIQLSRKWATPTSAASSTWRASRPTAPPKTPSPS